MIIQLKNRSHHVKYMQLWDLWESVGYPELTQILQDSDPDHNTGSPPPFIKQNYSKIPKKKKEKGKRSYLFMKWKFRLIFKIQIYCTYQLTKKKNQNRDFSHSLHHFCHFVWNLSHTCICYTVFYCSILYIYSCSNEYLSVYLILHYIVK